MRRKTANLHAEVILYQHCITVGKFWGCCRFSDHVLTSMSLKGLCSSGMLRSVDWQLQTFWDSSWVTSSNILQPNRNGALRLKMGSIGCPETSVSVDRRCVTSREGEDLVSTTAEACNHTSIFLPRNCQPERTPRVLSWVSWLIVYKDYTAGSE